MNVWDKLSQLNIPNKDKFQALFSDIVGKVQKKEFDLTIREEDNSDHYIIVEERLDSIFVHIVPKEAYELFKQMPKNEFIGFSVMAGNNVRVSCFGVECNLLGKSLFKK